MTNTKELMSHKNYIIIIKEKKIEKLKMKMIKKKY